jgi:diguanylate cyclase (GGDEF)-like protein
LDGGRSISHRRGLSINLVTSQERQKVESAPLDPSVAAVPINIDTTVDVPATALAPPASPEESEVAAPDAVLSESADAGVAPSPDAADWSDPLTGADGPRFWDRIIASETARARRYARPVTVGLVELIGLERLSVHWGPQVAERVLVGIGHTIAAEVRSSDHVARIGLGRFGVLLTETAEVPAINCFERIRTACEAELGPASVDVVIGFGWASPPPKGDLGQALEVAGKRLAADLRQSGA